LPLDGNTPHFTNTEALTEELRNDHVFPLKTETGTIRKVSDSIPKTVYFLSIIECAERASYWGVRTVFSNFFQFPLPVGTHTLPYACVVLL
jgi:hypothetical protein